MRNNGMVRFTAMRWSALNTKTKKMKKRKKKAAKSTCSAGMVQCFAMSGRSIVSTYFFKGCTSQQEECLLLLTTVLCVHFIFYLAAGVEYFLQYSLGVSIYGL